MQMNDCPKQLPYKNLVKIGIGGFATVYTGDICGKTVVIKHFKRKPGVKWLLQREFNFSSLVDHPNIRKALTYDQFNMYIVFEYCPGIDLFDFMDTFDEANSYLILPLFGQIVETVKYLHKLGIAHMGLKVENFILNTQTNKLTLIDFGQALLLRNDEYTIKGVHGTEQYLPPEFHKQRPVILYDKVDVWCCGIILYNLIYNRMPWKTANCNVDLTYQFFEDSLIQKPNELCPRLFPSMSYSGINASDENILREIFVGTLNPCPLKRFGINELYFKTNCVSCIKNNFFYNINSNGKREFPSKHIHKHRRATG
jgi:serine/threonine protein kinase